VVERPEPHVAPVIDIVEALNRRLAEKKKPVGNVAASRPEFRLIRSPRSASGALRPCT
jgi:hypothetical protein